MHRLVRVLAALFISTLFSASGIAQPTFPSKTIRLVVPYPPGSGTDNSARIFTRAIEERNGWQFIVENKPGASGLIGVQDMLRAPADGYTLVLTGGTTHGVNSALVKSLPYDPIADFIPIAPTSFVPYVLLVAPSLKVSTPAEFLTLLRANPGKYSFGTGSNFQRLVSETFKHEAKIDVANASYRGSAQVMTDLIGGHIAFAFIDTSAALPLLKSGRFKPLAITSTMRVPTLPDIPTMAQAGLPDLQMNGWSAIFVAKNTPKAVVTELRRVFDTQFNSAQWQDYSHERGGVTDVTRTPDELTAYIQKEIRRAKEIFALAGILPE